MNILIFFAIIALTSAVLAWQVKRRWPNVLGLFLMGLIPIAFGVFMTGMSLMAGTAVSIPGVLAIFPGVAFWMIAFIARGKRADPVVDIHEFFHQARGQKD
ncbi:hypothetical protein HYW55_06710 [Candidatus Gottesmanbacteria bacterium]|nr:hypothetical protein [Candidatus Gottesmanbacteria bacterium]